MLSGIGPKEDLDKLGIEVIQNLAVGKNLHDHPTINGLIIKLDKTKTTLVDLDQMKKDSLDYLKWHNNSIAAMGTLSSGCFAQTHLEQTPNYADFQFTFDGINVTVCEYPLYTEFLRELYFLRNE